MQFKMKSKLNSTSNWLYNEPIKKLNAFLQEVIKAAQVIDLKLQSYSIFTAGKSHQATWWFLCHLLSLSHGVCHKLVIFF